MMVPQEYEGTRVRIQCAKNARFSSGWLTSVNGKVIAIELNEDVDASADRGDLFLVEAYGNQSICSFSASFVSSKNLSAIFELKGTPRCLASAEDRRVQLQGIKALLRFGWFEVWGEVADAAPYGLGVIVNTFIETGEVAKIAMYTSAGHIDGKGEVRYCKKVDGMKGIYRIGIELEEFDRVNSARWSRYFESLTDRRAA